MKKLSLMLGIVCATATNLVSQSPSLTLLNSYSLTPNTTDTLGVFCRLFYHSARNKFYSIYASRLQGSTQPQGQMSNFAWREFDMNMNFTGNNGTLPGFTTAGDFALVQVDSTYFHLTNSGTNYKLSKFDDDFVSQGTVSIACGTNDSKMDQLMSYGNNRLIIGALYEPSTVNPTFPMQTSWTPQVHLFQFNTNLTPAASPQYLNPTYYSWGASAIFNNNKYYVVSMDSFPTYQLYSYEYDINWNYLARYPLSNDGQWSQGIVWDGTYYYVAYHSGGEHRSGNITIGIYDVNWTMVNTTQVTNNAVYPPPVGLNTGAQRPFLTKVGTKLYVSFDEETYNYTTSFPYYYLKFDWQARVKVYQINGVAGISEIKKSNLFNVYPNPANSELNIKSDDLDGEFSYTLKDVSTRLVLKGQSQQINISELQSGLYLLEIFDSKSQEQLFCKKIIKN